MRLLFITMFALMSFCVSGDEGQQRYQQRCVPCHSPGNAGWLQLSQRGDGKSPALLERNISADMVKQVVRNGLGAMPTITRIELSDKALADIIGFIESQ